MNADDNNAVFYDITVTAAVGCETVSDTVRIPEAELDDFITQLQGERFETKKVTVIDSIRNRQTPLRPSRFAYLHRSVPERPAESSVSPAKTHIEIKEALPDTVQQKIFSSDFLIGLKDYNWRPLSGTGHIHAIDRIAGTALATDGVLIAIKRHSDDSIIIGHLDNWVKDTAAAGGNGSKRRTSKTALLDELFA